LDKEGKPKVRILCPSTGLLKKVQTKIKSRVLAKFKFPQYIKGGIRGQDNIKNAKYHIGNKYKFATDIKDFFPSIFEKAVFHTFNELGYYPPISRILAKLVTFEGVLPQGAPTSNHIANLVFFPIDLKVFAYCASRKIKYTRYVDDLSFSAAFDFSLDSYPLIKIITPYFKVNRKKTFFTSGKAKFTGLMVGNSSLDVDEAFKERMKEDSNILEESKPTPRYRYYRRVRNA